jgi:hypothetical protein
MNNKNAIALLVVVSVVAAETRPVCERKKQPHVHSEAQGRMDNPTTAASINASGNQAVVFEDDGWMPQVYREDRSQMIAALRMLQIAQDGDAIPSFESPHIDPETYPLRQTADRNVAFVTGGTVEKSHGVDAWILLPDGRT